MGNGPVTESQRTRQPPWQLGDKHNAKSDAQGIVVSAYTHLPHARALFLHAGSKGGQWLNKLREIAPITNAEEKKEPAAALAFTCTGLKQLRLSDKVLKTFSKPFYEGMFEKDRRRRLGDFTNGGWSAAVVKEGPKWSGNSHLRDAIPRSESAAVVEGAPSGNGRDETVHALLLLYESSDEKAKSWAKQVEAALGQVNVKVVHSLSLDPGSEAGPVAHEHFGFADGLSQPIPFDAGGAVLLNGKPATWGNPYHGVPLGEILLGHTNAHREKAPCPFVEDDRRSRDILKSDFAPERFRNLGINGSYMVVRELQQDVAGFWNSMKREADEISKDDPSARHVDDVWLAERVIGRTMDGHVLGKKKRGGRDGLPANSFGFIKDDPYGHGCPLGSHIRRGNPRDGQAKSPSSARGALAAANNHRILRRGRNYGLAVPKPAVINRYKCDGQTRGLLFICLNTDIVRQFEFIQQTWILNPDFAVLFDQTDPLVGPHGPFTIPRKEALRRRVTVDTFVRLAGGEYFFLPSIPALDYLQQL